MAKKASPALPSPWPRSAQQQLSLQALTEHTLCEFLYRNTLQFYEAL